ncbi:hypothetical protein NPIL_419861 [Nephila pilipes]|uniref:Uncharacterized protein n=1 Tax=Nephila pilipes TaxID=299642 RepID=A0A8X6ICE7_NEPPI|nr:hypothetical protein NPIL_139651 [Nephila pilipes]GFT63177.1 hypothetical protein NPIL_419861 [Nephila pilipes]
MYPSALSTKINSDVEFSRHLVESRSDKLRQVKSSPIHADFCSEAAIGGKKNNSTQKEELNNSTVERKQFNSTATCSACTLKTKTKTIAEGKQLNSTATCAACSACTLKTKTVAGEKQLNSKAGEKQLNSTSACAACSSCSTLQQEKNNSTRPPPAQPFAAESAFLTY